jgi:hypothetical protein
LPAFPLKTRTVTRGKDPDVATNQPLRPSPSVVSKVTGSTSVSPISPGVGTPAVGKYIERRCIVQRSINMVAMTATTYPAAMIIGWLILPLTVLAASCTGTHDADDTHWMRPFGAVVIGLSAAALPRAESPAG